MTKQEWIEHIQGTAANQNGPGLIPPSEGGNAEEWHRVLTAHRNSDSGCPACKARSRILKAARARKDREQAYRDAGLVKGRTGLGRVIWE
jgi:hypothetical protein